MMEILAFVILLFLTLRTIVSLVNFFSRLHLPDKKPSSFPKISILIPARNEESNLGNLLETLHKLEYPDFEVLVCNDHSSDNTEEILNWVVGEDDRIHWFLGEKLPTDWLGKNFACHQLAQKATGKYLIFLDADVALSANAITKAVAFFQEKQLSLLSVFPQQKMETFAERLTVPLMNWILQSLLPVILVQKTPFPSVSAANGQFMMFETENYRTSQWHSKVRNQNVEDIRIARMMKSESLKVAVLLGNQDIFCRMYRNFNEAVVGFSRNMHEYFGGARAVMIGFWFVVCSGPLLVWAVLGWTFLSFFMGLVIVNRIVVAADCRQNIAWPVLLHPLQMISFTVIVFYNIYRRFRKDSEWKGRIIKF
ncbi:MAG: glycosyltransferase family A protein [Bacteroidota bacterium]|nr:glycosyl transferase family 2 [Odoribacter sp.]MDP3642543.1 glycosyltransferase family A protein [Bacteroidota bacterium]